MTRAEVSTLSWPSSLSLPHSCRHPSFRLPSGAATLASQRPIFLITWGSGQSDTGFLAAAADLVLAAPDLIVGTSQPAGQAATDPPGLRPLPPALTCPATT